MVSMRKEPAAKWLDDLNDSLDKDLLTDFLF